MKLKDINLLDVGNTIQIVGAVYADDKKVLICLFPEDRGEIQTEQDHSYGDCMGTATSQLVTKDKKYLDIDVLDMDAEDWLKFLKQTDVMETEILTKASDGTLAKAIYRKSQRQIDQVVSWQVFKRDSYTCRYCGNDAVPLTVDHLVRWEEGGPTIADNLVASCKKCNKTRGNLSYEEWLRHPRYLEVSKSLTVEVRALNEDLVGKIRFIKRNVHVRTR